MPEGGERMQIDIKIDREVKEPKVLIITDEMTPEINEIIRKISEDSPEMLAGFRHSEVIPIDPDDIIRIYTGDGKVFAVTSDGEFQLRLRLYELETRLNGRQFVRISNSEIVHLKKIKSFDLSMTGTIQISFLNGTTTYVSRRYVSKIKQVLGM